ncbi:hypothetical protein [Spirosoma areae]
METQQLPEPQDATKIAIQGLTDRQLKALLILCEAVMEDKDGAALKSMGAIESLIGSEGDETMGYWIPILAYNEANRRIDLKTPMPFPPNMTTEGRV